MLLQAWQQLQPQDPAEEVETPDYTKQPSTPILEQTKQLSRALMGGVSPNCQP